MSKGKKNRIKAIRNFEKSNVIFTLIALFVFLLLIGSLGAYFATGNSAYVVMACCFATFILGFVFGLCLVVLHKNYLEVKNNTLFHLLRIYLRENFHVEVEKTDDPDGLPVYIFKRIREFQ